jgi:hypothetical protein
MSSDQPTPGPPYRDYLPSAQRDLPPGWRSRSETESGTDVPQDYGGYVTLHRPGVHRGWLALSTQVLDGPPNEIREAATFEEIADWAFSKTENVYVAEPDGSRTRLSPPQT